MTRDFIWFQRFCCVLRKSDIKIICFYESMNTEYSRGVGFLSGDNIRVRVKEVLVVERDVPDNAQPVFLCIDDTMAAKFGENHHFADPCYRTGHGSRRLRHGKIQTLRFFHNADDDEISSFIISYKILKTLIYRIDIYRNMKYT